MQQPCHGGLPSWFEDEHSHVTRNRSRPPVQTDCVAAALWAAHRSRQEPERATSGGRLGPCHTSRQTTEIGVTAVKIGLAR